MAQAYIKPEMKADNMADDMDPGIKPIAEGIFSMPSPAQPSPRLIGGFCATCDRKYFPRSGYCPTCLGEVEEISLDSKGTLYCFTVVRTKPPFGLPQPYGIGYVDLTESGLRIFCLLDPASIDQLRIGLRVKLAVGPLGHDGHGAPRLRPYFTADTED